MSLSLLVIKYRKELTHGKTYRPRKRWLEDVIRRLGGQRVGSVKLRRAGIGSVVRRGITHRDDLKFEMHRFTRVRMIAVNG